MSQVGGPYRPGTVPLKENDDRRLFCKYHYKGLLTLLIPIVFGPILLGKPVVVCRYLYITVCVYLFLVLDLMSKGALAFAYVIFSPIAGLAGSSEICMSYYTDLMFLVYGCSFMGTMLDSSKVSQHLAFIVIRIVGSNIDVLQIFLTFAVFLTAFFVSPTLATVLGIKVAQAVLVEYDAAGIMKKDSDEERFEPDAPPYPTRSVAGIYLTCCFTASMAGGLSPFVNPNGYIFDAFLGQLKIQHIMLIMVVPTLLGLCVTILWLQILFFGLLRGRVKRVTEVADKKENFKQSVADRKEELGRWKCHAILVLLMILLTALIMHTRKPRLYPGWDDISNKMEAGLSVQSLGLIIFFIAIPANYLFCKYYACRPPEKAGAAPSLVSWKAINSDTSWGDILMLGAAMCGVFSARESGFYARVADTMIGPKEGNFLQFLCGACFGTLFSALAPSTQLIRIALPVLMPVGSHFSLAFATSVHNQFLLSTSSPANTITAGFGNIRAYQFLIGGIVPTLFMMVAIPSFTWIFFDTALPH